MCLFFLNTSPTPDLQLATPEKADLCCSYSQQSMNVILTSYKVQLNEAVG